MLFAVLFEDDPDKAAEARAQHMPAHLEFLKRNKNSIKAAGPLQSDAGEPSGGIWIVEADAIDAVNALVHEDPFWPTGLRKSVRVQAWRQVFADGQVLI